MTPDALVLLGVEYTLHFHRSLEFASVNPVILTICPLQRATAAQRKMTCPWPVLGEVQPRTVSWLPILPLSSTQHQTWIVIPALLPMSCVIRDTACQLPEPASETSMSFHAFRKHSL